MDLSAGMNGVVGAIPKALFTRDTFEAHCAQGAAFFCRGAEVIHAVKSSTVAFLGNGDCFCGAKGFDSADAIRHKFEQHVPVPR